MRKDTRLTIHGPLTRFSGMQETAKQDLVHINRRVAILRNTLSIMTHNLPKSERQVPAYLRDAQRLLYEVEDMITEGAGQWGTDGEPAHEPWTGPMHEED